MLAATMLAIFIVPVLFIAITRLAYGKKKLEELEKGRTGNESTTPDLT
jgi:HAE1 family hydrophobic/amphiphilic exporter-1